MTQRRHLAASAALMIALSIGVAVAGGVPYKPMKNEAFKAGEKLEFALKYEFVSAGTAVMEVQEGPMIDNRPTMNILSSAKSNKVIDKMFKVRDFNGSTVDKETLASVHFHQNLKEGKYHVVRNTKFDYPARSYRYERVSKGKTNEKIGPLDQLIHDILSSFFVARTLPLELGCEYAIDVFSDGTIYPLAVRVGAKTETVKVPAGKFECLRLEPIIVGDSIFKASDGKMTLWVTNDARHMPVLIRSKVAVGAFDAELAKFRN